MLRRTGAFALLFALVVSTVISAGPPIGAQESDVGYRVAEATPVVPPETVRSTGPDATHLVHLTLDVLLADEDLDFPIRFEPGPDEACIIHGELWIEMSEKDGSISPYRIGPPPPGVNRSSTPTRGYVLDSAGRDVLFVCGGEVSVCWWDTTVELFADGSARLDLDIRFFEGGGGLFGPYQPCSPGDQKDRASLTITAPPDRHLHCNRTPVSTSNPDDFFGPWTVQDGDEGAEVQACVGVHPMDEIASFDAWLVNGTTAATNSLSVTAAAQAYAYEGVDRYRWDFGDGTTFTTIAPGGGTASASHIYNTPGVYWLTVTALPNRAQPETVDVARIVILAPAGPPVAVIQAPDQVGEGEPVIFDASTSLPGQGNEGEIAEYRWDFGDGTQITLDAFDTQSWEHTYNADGTYTVTLTAAAMNGLEDTTTHVIEVD